MLRVVLGGRELFLLVADALPLEARTTLQTPCLTQF
jgi:hypothetical protein